MTQEYGVNVFNSTMNPHGVVTLTRLFFQVLLQEMNSSSVDDKGYFRKEMVLSDNALKYAEAVLALDGGPLEQLKARFTVSSRGTSSSGGNGSGKLEETLKSTPPIGQLNDLRTIAECLKSVEKVYDMENKTDWANVKADIAKLLVPCKELIKEIKERVGSFEKRQKSRTDQKKQRKSMAGPRYFLLI